LLFICIIWGCYPPLRISFDHENYCKSDHAYHGIDYGLRQEKWFLWSESCLVNFVGILIYVCKWQDYILGRLVDNLALRYLNLARSDPGGYQWPPTYSNWLKTVFWQLIIFSSFSVPKLLEPFLGPKWRFSGIKLLNNSQRLWFSPQNESPPRYLSNELSCAQNGYCMPKLHPREVDTPKIGSTKLLAFHILRLGFWILFMLKGLWSLIVTIVFFQMIVSITSLLKDKLLPF